MNRTLRVVSIAISMALLSETTHAVVPVFDAEAIAQLRQQLSYWRDQLSTAQSQLAALTGPRGMGRLNRVPVAARNYLPESGNDIGLSLTGADSRYGTLARSYQRFLANQGVLAPERLATRSAAEQQSIQARRAAATAALSLADATLTATSSRYEELQRLLDTIDLTSDPKAALDLQARIAAEQLMLVNDTIKSAAVMSWARAQSSATDARSKEAAVKGHGDFASRFHPAAD